VIERSVNMSVNSLIGNNDTNLKTIVKMSIMQDMNKLETEEMESILQKLQENNAIEKYYVEREYGLTYDLCGNIIPINGIDEKEN
jgi:DNA integrity scanning protein DisA with diadenylate cyclase activity